MGLIVSRFVCFGTLCLVTWTTCQTAAYHEKRRQPEEIDLEIEQKYRNHLQDAQAKHNVMFAQIRGQDTKLDGSMNKLVWGGKAKMEPPNGNNRGSGGGSSSSSESDAEWDDDDDLSVSSSASSSSDRESMTEEEKRAERKARRRRRKQKKKERALKKKKEQQQLQAKRKEQIKQVSIAAASLGAVAAVASVLLKGNQR